MTMHAKPIESDFRADLASAKTKAVEKGSEIADAADARAKELTDNAMRELSALATSLNARLKDLGVDADRMIEGAKEGAVSLEKRLADEVVSRPLRSLAIAAGLGIALGFLTRK